MGDYPDHHKRKAGSKKTHHYNLNLNRSSLFIQSTDQKLHTLFWPATSKLQLSRHPSEALHQFRNEVGFNVPIKEFLVWYKQNFPDDYGKVF